MFLMIFNVNVPSKVSIIILKNLNLLLNFQGERIQDVYKFQVMITTFEIILTDCMELKAIPWRCVIIDEAHRLKNRNCKLLEGLRMLNTV